MDSPAAAKFVLNDIGGLIDTARAIYGELGNPNYDLVSKKILDGVPRATLNRLVQSFWVRDFTEPNTDVGFFIDLICPQRRLNLIISGVAPVFFAFEWIGGVGASLQDRPKKLASLEQKDIVFLASLLGADFKFINSEQLLRDIEFGGEVVPLYKAIFTFDQEMEWLQNF